MRVINARKVRLKCNKKFQFSFFARLSNLCKFKLLPLGHGGSEHGVERRFDYKLCNFILRGFFYGVFSKTT